MSSKSTLRAGEKEYNQHSIVTTHADGWGVINKKAPVAEELFGLKRPPQSQTHDLRLRVATSTGLSTLFLWTIATLAFSIYTTNPYLEEFPDLNSNPKCVER